MSNYDKDQIATAARLRARGFNARPFGTSGAVRVPMAKGAAMVTVAEDGYRGFIAEKGGSRRLFHKFNLPRLEEILGQYV